MRGMNAIAIAAAIVYAAGCGATAQSRTQGAAERTMMSDGEWYREAIEEALVAYQRAIHTTDAQASRPRCFDALLVHSLAERGLTTRGLDVYAIHHPEFASELDREVRPRLDRMRRNDPQLATCAMQTDTPQASALYNVHLASM